MRIRPVRVIFDEKDRREVLTRMEEVLSTGMLAQGKYVAEFERRWAEYVGTKHAVAVSSGSSAIEIAMRILGVQHKEVLVPDNTFAATAVGVVLAGGRVQFVDTAPTTFSIRPDALKARCTPSTVGLIVVHVGGIITPEIETIARWCKDQGLWLFEDCAHGHGSEWRGKRAGTFGIAGAYSFFVTKVMTTAEGGMIVTDDDAFAEQARLLRNHGKPQPWVSYNTHLGSNWRMSELNAIVGLTQLKRLDDFIAWRDRIAGLYTEWLQEIPEIVPVLPLDRSSWYKYIVLLPRRVNRSVLKEEMKERGVQLSGEVYALPLHRQPIFQAIAEGEFPGAEEICSHHICLPLYYGMTQEEARFVIDTLKAALEEIQCWQRD
jgi:perosamine synthetase